MRKIEFIPANADPQWASRAQAIEILKDRYNPNGFLEQAMERSNPNLIAYREYINQRFGYLIVYAVTRDDIKDDAGNIIN